MVPVLVLVPLLIGVLVLVAIYSLPHGVRIYVEEKGGTG